MVGMTSNVFFYLCIFFVGVWASAKTITRLAEIRVVMRSTRLAIPSSPVRPTVCCHQFSSEYVCWSDSLYIFLPTLPVNRLAADYANMSQVREYPSAWITPIGIKKKQRVMSITRTQVFLVNISNLRPGEGLWLEVGKR